MRHAKAGPQPVLCFLAAALALRVAAAQTASPSASGAAGAGAGARALRPVSAILDPATLAAVKAEGRAVRVAAGKDAAQAALTPAVPAGKVLSAEIQADAPTMLVEAVFLLSRPAPADPSAEYAAAYSILRSISSLEGIQYWSASRKTWRTFYEESWRIDAPDTKRRIPDGLPAGGIPADVTLHAWQKDLSFGGNIYRYRYRSYAAEGAAPAVQAPGGTGTASAGAAAGGVSAILVDSTNLTQMYYKFLPVMGPEGLATRLLVLPCAEGILFYASSAADAPGVPLLRGKLEDSFTNRAAALFAWFGERYAALGKGSAGGR